MFGRGEQSFDAREIWLGLVVLSSNIARFEQNEGMDRIPVFALPLSKDWICPLPRVHATWYTLVWGLSTLGSQISLNYAWPQRVPIFAAEIKGTAGALGAIIIRNPEPVDTATPSNGSNTDFVTTSRRRDEVMMTNLGADQGIIYSVENPDLVIRYRFFPEQLTPGPTLQAFLNAQTYFSWYDKSMRYVNMQAFSDDRRVRINVHGVSSRLGQIEMTWGLARIGVVAVWRALVMGYSIQTESFTEGQRFQSITWTYQYKGFDVGQGSLSW
ncbi:MAG: hypothetical protein LQ350_004121 [Teloschistes chrysophthalmus]|nr:MAG: hypothetical protein LQ350_004121 [Niorma chrysophthalma]